MQFESGLERQEIGAVAAAQVDQSASFPAPGKLTQFGFEDGMVPIAIPTGGDLVEGRGGLVN